MTIWEYIDQTEAHALRLCKERSGITIDLPALQVMDQLAEAGWTYREEDYPHGNWDVMINHVQLKLDGAEWKYSADIVILMPAEYDSTPAGVHDGLRDGGGGHRVHGPRRRVYEFIIEPHGVQS